MLLGKPADPEEQVPIGALGEAMQGMDEALDALYDAQRKGGLGSSSPMVNRWLGDIRRYFPASTVQIMQKDAVERLGIGRLLLEPELLESVTPDVALLGTILSLNKAIPDKTKATARMVVGKVVAELQEKLSAPLRQSIEGSIHRASNKRRPRLQEVDWARTIRKNLKHYQAEYETIVPHEMVGHGRKSRQLRHVILLVDQSGSMASSVVYASICAAVMASIKSLKTSMVVFDTNIMDLTEMLEDPVDLLFGTQLGGGTDINKALQYAEKTIERPTDTILLLISDLYEGGNEAEMIQRAAAIKALGVQFISLLALTDEGSPDYDRRIAAKLASLNIPVFAATPDMFPDIMAKAIRGDLGM
jgi:Mg-chelatase subunit ChlD